MQKFTNDGPLISVITVVFNGARYVEQTIQSVLNQTYDNLEYIIIDGGSTDGTVDIIRTYEPQLAYWHSKPDRGIAQAFNLGLAQARGAWIVILASDDLFLGPQVVELMVPHLISHCEMDIVFGETIILTSNQNPKPQPFAKIYGHPWRWQEFRWTNTIPHPSAFTNHDFFERVGNFNESYRVVMDYDLYLRGGKNLGAHYVPIAVTGMREGGASRASIYKTCREARRAQQASKTLPTLIAWLNFFWQIIRIYAGKAAHKILDPIASQVTRKGRNTGTDCFEPLQKN